MDFDDDLLFLALQEQYLPENHERMEEAEVQILRQAVSSGSSSSSSDESEEESTTISILNGFQQIMPGSKFVEAIKGFYEPHYITSAILPCGKLTFGKVPLISINFKDLNLSGIIKALNEAEDDMKPGIRSLRNYLLCKKKISKDKPLISLIPGTIPPGRFKDFLEVDKPFLEKLSSCLWDPFIKIKLKVQRTRRDQSEETFHFIFEKGRKLKISEVLKNGSNPGDQDEIRIPLKRKENREEKSTMEVLMKDDKSSCTFTLSFEVAVGEAPEIPEVKLRSDLILQSIYNLEGKDVTIIAANGAEIKCHKNVIIAQSEPFYSMLTPEYEMVEVQTGKIELKENSEEGIEQFVKLLYGFPLPVETITCEMAVEVFQLANKYGVKELEGSMMDFLCLKDMQFFNADTILELYYYTRNIESLGELTAHALTEMSTLSEETLTGCEYFKKLPRDDAVKLLCTLLQWKN